MLDHQRDDPPRTSAMAIWKRFREIRIQGKPKSRGRNPPLQSPIDDLTRRRRQGP
jgi:hypothetical protein